MEPKTPEPHLLQVRLAKKSLDFRQVRRRWLVRTTRDWVPMYVESHGTFESHVPAPLAVDSGQTRQLSANL